MSETDGNNTAFQKKNILGAAVVNSFIPAAKQAESGQKKGEKDAIRFEFPSQSTVGRWAQERRDRWERYERPRLKYSLFRNVNYFYCVSALSDRINWTEAELCMKLLM